MSNDPSDQTMTTDYDDDVPVKLLTPVLTAALVAAAASFFISVTTQKTVNGEVTSFMDYGAIAGGGLAVLLALASIKDALGPWSGDKKVPRLAIIGAVIAVGAYRLLYGLGVFI